MFHEEHMKKEKKKHKHKDSNDKDEKMNNDRHSDDFSPTISLLTKRKRSHTSADRIEINNPHKPINLYSTKDFRLTLNTTLTQQFNTNFQLLQSDFAILESYEKVFFKDTSLDVMFIMDITGSMGMWLSEAKAQLSNIIDEITGNNPCSKIRMSFIGYRDFTDDSNPIGQYASLDFTENIDEVNEFISKLSAYGGGDEPEDIAGALNISLNMNWQSSARYAVLVCDAPCHGKKYHSSIYDKYSTGDPNGLVIETLVEEIAKKNITLYCVEINNSTKKMLALMNEVYFTTCGKALNVESLGSAVNKFGFFVALSASVTLRNITYNKIKLEDVVRQFREDTIETIVKKYNKDVKEINDNLAGLLDNMNLNESEQKMFDFISRMNSLNIAKSISTTISIIPPINDNDQIIIDNDNNTNDNIIISINNDNDILLINQDMINEQNAYKLYMAPIDHYITVNAICHSINLIKHDNFISNWASPFTLHSTISTELHIRKEAYIINEHYCLIIKDTILDAQGISLLSKATKPTNINLQSYLIKYTQYAVMNQIANYFNMKQIEISPSFLNYIRFNNHWLYECNNKSLNTKYLQFEQRNGQGTKGDISKGIKEAFSHFSYQISEGYLLISDLESENGYIVNQKLSTLETPNYSIEGVNDGYREMMKFFVKHFCNDVCKKLGLVHPRKKEDLKENKNFYYQEDPLNPKICELCLFPFMGKETLCYQCVEINNKSEKKGICDTCHSNFEYYNYFYIKKRISPPTKCHFCHISFC